MWKDIYDLLLPILTIGDNTGVFPVYLTTSAIWAAVFLCVWVIYWIISRPMSALLVKIAAKTPTVWDDYLLTSGNIRKAAQFICALILASVLPHTLTGIPSSVAAIVKICGLLKTVTATILILSLIKSLFDGFNRENINLHGLLVLRNILTTVIIGIATLVSLSIILGRDISYLLSCLGAMAAVLMLVFKDSILGVVAGVKLTVNKMLRAEDWIKVPKFGIDGVVKDITLSAVKVRNFDNSIVTIPPYELISGGFINMEEMKREGGRRIKRSILIDINSIRFMSVGEQQRWAGEKWAEGIDLNRQTVNLTLFRHYLESAIMTHSTACHGMLNMVRELEPTPQGVPIEIYLFTDQVNWKEYESVAAEISDSVLASVNEFDLRIYQQPSGVDFRPTTPTPERRAMKSAH